MDPSTDIDPMHYEGGITSRITNPTHNNTYSTPVSFNTERLSSATRIPSTTTGISGTATRIQKRKFSFSHGESLPIHNQEKEILIDAESTAAKEPPWMAEGEPMDDFDSDEFYRGIDFDGLEEEATKKLRSRSEALGKVNDKLNNQLGFFGLSVF
ncbi:hypothetical protein Lser_V15G40744 [Lactuca serriola]